MCGRGARAWHTVNQRAVRILLEYILVVPCNGVVNRRQMKQEGNVDYSPEIVY